MAEPVRSPSSPFFQIPKEVHNLLIASSLELKILVRVFLASKLFNQRCLYGFANAHHLPTPLSLNFSKVDNGLNAAITWSNRPGNTFKQLRSLPTLEATARLATRTDPCRIQSCVFPTSVNEQEFLEALRHMRSTLTVLELSSARQAQLACAVEGGFPNLRVLRILAIRNEGEPINLLEAPNLEILQLEQHQLGDLVDVKKFSRLRAVACGPGRGVPHHIATLADLQIAITSIKTLLPPSVALNVSILRPVSNWCVWGSPLSMLSVKGGLGVEAIKLLLANGCALDDNISYTAFKYPPSGSQSPTSLLEFVIQQTGQKPEIFIPILGFLLQDPTLNWNFLQGDILLRAATSRHEKVKELIFTARTVESIVKYQNWPDSRPLATAFSIPKIKRCHLLTALLNDPECSPAHVKWLMQYEIGPTLFHIDARNGSSVFHGRSGGGTAIAVAVGAWHPDTLQFLFFDCRANPKLLNDDGISSVEYLLEHSSLDELEQFVETFGVAPLIQAAPFKSLGVVSRASHMLFSKSWALSSSSKQWSKEICKVVGSGLRMDQIVNSLLTATVIFADSLSTCLETALCVLRNKGAQPPTSDILAVNNIIKAIEAKVKSGRFVDQNMKMVWEIERLCWSYYPEDDI